MLPEDIRVALVGVGLRSQVFERYAARAPRRISDSPAGVPLLAGQGCERLHDRFVPALPELGIHLGVPRLEKIALPGEDREPDDRRHGDVHVREEPLVRVVVGVELLIAYFETRSEEVDDRLAVHLFLEVIDRLDAVHYILEQLLVPSGGVQPVRKEAPFWWARQLGPGQKSPEERSLGRSLHLASRFERRDVPRFRAVVAGVDDADDPLRYSGVIASAAIEGDFDQFFESLDQIRTLELLEPSGDDDIVPEVLSVQIRERFVEDAVRAAVDLEDVDWLPHGTPRNCIVAEADG